MRSVIAILVCSLLSIPLAPDAAEACINGTVMEEDEAVKKVRLAERALEKGQARKALRLLAADHYFIESRPLLKKIRILKAVAQLRQGRSKRAERVFRNLLKKDADSPFLKTRLAEALYRRKGDDAVEAWTIMNDLETRDLVPDARGYAVLATLRARAKDTEGRERALARCKQMAGKNSSLCS